MTERQSSEEALRGALDAHRKYGRKGENAENAVVARNVLHEDLGWHTNQPFSYDFNDDVRDRLIAHARQDASHAVMNASSALDAIRSLRRLVWFQFVVIVILSVAMHAPR